MNFIKEENRIYCVDTKGNLVAEITFQKLKNDVYNIDHTFVDESLRGKGVAKQLVELAIDEIKSKGGQVQATCSYAKHYLNNK